MTIAQLIEHIIDTAHGNVNLRRDYGKVRKSLRHHLGDSYDTLPAITIITPGWAEAYHSHLLTTYTPTLTPARQAALDASGPQAWADMRATTADVHIKILRRIVRLATADGILPAVDPLGGIPGYARAKGVVAPDTLALIARAITLAGQPGFRAVGAYLLALCRGADTPFLAAQRQALGEGYDEAAARDLLQRAGIDLLRSCTLTDRLSAGVAIGIDHGALRRIAAGSTDPADVAADARIAGHIAAMWQRAHAAATRRYWVAITSYGRPAETLMDQLLLTDPATPLAANLRGHLYLACESQHHRLARTTPASAMPPGPVTYDPATTVLKHILFAHITTDTARTIERTVPHIWIFQTPRRSGNYLRIPDEQFNAMRSILNRFGDTDGIDLAVAPPTTTHLDPHDTVTIDLPGYEGIHAVVARLNRRRSTPTKTYYTVTFTAANGARMELTLLSSLLTPVTR